MLSSQSSKIIHEVNLVAYSDFVELTDTCNFNFSMIKDSDSYKALSGASFLISRLNANGINSSNTKGSSDGSLVNITVQGVRKTVEGENGSTNSVGSQESVVKRLSSVDKSVSWVVGCEDTENLITLNLPIVVVPRRSSPELSTGGVDDIKDELSVHPPASTISNSDGNRPSTSLHAATANDSSNFVKFHEVR